MDARFRIVQRLADAHYGDVWLYEDIQTDHARVAVKTISLRRARQALDDVEAARANTRGATDRMVTNVDDPWQERATITRLMALPAHAHIVRFQRVVEETITSSTSSIGDTSPEDTRWHVVMEYCDQGDLLTLVQNEPTHRLAETQCLHFFRQIVHGVQFLHSHGLAHRDLSLENVLLHGQNECKLCDFGLSTTTERECEGIVGKDYYRAPEIVAGKTYDAAKADMWALGIMLFIMITGSPLAWGVGEGKHITVILQCYGIRKILELWRSNTDLSNEVMDLLEGLLQLEPSKRLSISDVVAHAWF